MRKVSKSRADDDVVSSTNGSILNDDQPDTNKSTDVQGRANESDLNKNNDSDNEPLTTSKLMSKKARSRGTKTKKADKKGKKVIDHDQDTEEEYEVEKVIDSKKIKGKLHYLIRWKGYSADSDTWEPENTLSCPELIAKFNEEKENSKDKEEKTPTKKTNKRKLSKKESKPSKRPKSEWDSDNADSNAEYEVDRILEVHHKKNGEREFLIHWKGWSSKFDSWEPESNLNCSELIKKFMEKVDVARTTESRNLRVAPGTTNRFTLQDPTSGRRLSKRRGQRQRVRYDGAE